MRILAMVLGLGLAGCNPFVVPEQLRQVRADRARTEKYRKFAEAVKERQAELNAYLEEEVAKCKPKLLQLDGNGSLVCVSPPPTPPTPPQGK